ncbi:hypothetical protein ACFS4T_05560 [Pseudomonas lini]
MQPLTRTPGFLAKAHTSPGQAELAANYITAKLKRPRPKPGMFSNMTA